MWWNKKEESKTESFSDTLHDLVEPYTLQVKLLFDTDKTKLETFTNQFADTEYVTGIDLRRISSQDSLHKFEKKLGTKKDAYAACISYSVPWKGIGKVTFNSPHSRYLKLIEGKDLDTLIPIVNEFALTVAVVEIKLTADADLANPFIAHIQYRNFFA